MYFLCKAHYSLLVLRDTREHLGTIMEGRRKQWDHWQKEQGMKNTALNQKAKRTCLWYECWNKKTYHLFNLSCENVHWATQIFSHFAQNQEWLQFVVVQSLSQLPAPCNPLDCSTPGFPILHYLLRFAQNYVHWVSDAIQQFYHLSPPLPPAHNLSLWCKNCG